MLRGYRSDLGGVGFRTNSRIGLCGAEADEIDFEYGGAYARQHGKKGEGVSMADKKIEKCAHPGCNCPATKKNKYCSDYCESIGKQPSIACNCGHVECAAGEAAGTAR
jgi:hypothetical protein